MKLSSNPKPVKFRIVSGGEEHSSLETLRMKFCIKELKENSRKLLQWLRRQGAEGEKIATELERLPKPFGKCDSLTDYYIIYKIFFKDIVPFNTSVNSLRKLYDWFLKNKQKYINNLDFLEEILFYNDEEFRSSFIHKPDRIKKYIAFLKGSNNKLDQFMLGRYLLEEKIDSKGGKELILEAKKKGLRIAIEYSEKNKDTLKMREWKNVNIEYIKKFIKLTLDGKSTGLYYTTHSWTQEEKGIKEFVDNCLKIKVKQTDREKYNRAVELFAVKERTVYRILDTYNLAKERQFIIYMLGFRLSDVKDHCFDGMKRLADSYFPAKYFITTSETNPILDGIGFRNQTNFGRINSLLLNMFEF